MIDWLSFDRHFVAKIVLSTFSILANASLGTAQQIPAESSSKSSPDESSEPRSSVKAPKQVDVQPQAADEKIAARLERILSATGWFTAPAVEVEEGVVFLEGTAQSIEHRQWAEELARSTQDVVAVVNKLDVEIRPVWDLQPALVGLHELGRDIVALLPFVFGARDPGHRGIGLLGGDADGPGDLAPPRATRAPPRGNRAPCRRIVFIVGFYIVLRVCGLSRLALTVIGGTGLIGLVIGIAFRDITENFLASIFLSAQRPFRVGDLVEIADVLGYVQRLTVRTTILMTLDGNHVQIPNSIVYKSTIRNFTSNPNRREQFTVGIGYDVPIVRAQEVALAAVQSHTAVLKEPEPWVLADSLGPATVNLRVYFWLNGSVHSWLKVRSSVIRLVKRAFQENGIDMPDEARELVFPRGVPVRLIDERDALRDNNAARAPATRDAQPPIAGTHSEPQATGAEGGLTADADELENQARQAQSPEAGENLLASH